MKVLEPERPSLGLPPWVVQCKDRDEEARFVVARARELHASGIPWSEIAVLYRSHALSTEVQVELAKQGIPFVVRSGVRFFEQAHIKDVLAFGRAMMGDELALRRVLLLYPGVGPVAVRGALEHASVDDRFSQIAKTASGTSRRGLFGG